MGLHFRSRYSMSFMRVTQGISKVPLGNIVLATAVTCTHGVLLQFKVTLTTIPCTLIGLALAIFLGFRNTAACDRYGVARKLWGELVLRSRNLARQCPHLIAAPPAGQAGLRERISGAPLPFSRTPPLEPVDSCLL